MKKKFKPLISIIMINYNGLNYLKKTIQPLLNFKYKPYEVIIVDNGSNDGSVSYIKKFKNIRFIKSPKEREKNFACNYAFKHSKGKYILFLDNDALVNDKSLLNNLLENYIWCDNCGLLGLAYYDIDKNITNGYGGYLGYYFSKERKMIPLKQLSRYHGTQIGFPHGLAFFIERVKWEEINGYDENLIFGGDDSDIGIRLGIRGYKNYLYAKCPIIHLGINERTNNKTYSRKWKYIFSSHLYTILKDYSSLNLIPSIFIYSVFGFLKSLKQSLVRISLGPLIGFFLGYIIFLSKISLSIEKRKDIQKNRIIKSDNFLKINPKEFR